MRRESAYDKMLKRLVEQADRLDDDAVARVKVLLENLRTRLADRVLATEWDQYHVPALLREIEETAQTFAAAMRREQTATAANAWNVGIDQVDLPLASAGIRMTAPVLDRAALSIMQGYSDSLIKNLGADAVKRINTEIATGILGGVSPYQAMQNVNGILGLGEAKGITHRAETIVRTEWARVTSNARHARMLQTTAHPTDPPVEWQKKWISSSKRYPRLTHDELDGTMVPLNEKFPFGIDYPHAPGLPAREVINCGCTHVLVCDWDSLPQQFDPLRVSPQAEYPDKEITP